MEKRGSVVAGAITEEAIIAAAAAEVPPETDPVLREWDRRRTRLYLLRGMPCPLCRRAGRALVPGLEWTGVSLACPEGHGWNNPDSLRADMLEGGKTRRKRRRASP